MPHKDINPQIRKQLKKRISELSNLRLENETQSCFSNSNYGIFSFRELIENNLPVIS